MTESQRLAVADFDAGRRRLLGRLAAMTASAGAISLVGGGLSGAVGALLATPARADTGLDIQILQTASGLERLAVNAYTAVLNLPFIKSGHPWVIRFAQTTMMQHDDHRKAFQAQTAALGGPVQDAPDPKYTPSLVGAIPNLKTALEVVQLAATLETVARDTYLSDLAQFSGIDARKLAASVCGVESQHLAILRAMTTLLQAGNPDLMSFPVSVTKVPAALGTVGFADGPFPRPTMASPPSQGARA